MSGRVATKCAGPPAVALARHMVATRMDLTIEPLETTSRLDPMASPFGSGCIFQSAASMHDLSNRH